MQLLKNVAISGSARQHSSVEEQSKCHLPDSDRSAAVSSTKLCTEREENSFASICVSFLARGSTSRKAKKSFKYAGFASKGALQSISAEVRYLRSKLRARTESFFSIEGKPVRWALNNSWIGRMIYPTTHWFDWSGTSLFNKPLTLRHCNKTYCANGEPPRRCYCKVKIEEQVIKSDSTYPFNLNIGIKLSRE